VISNDQIDFFPMRHTMWCANYLWDNWLGNKVQSWYGFVQIKLYECIWQGLLGFHNLHYEEDRDG
jgi:hypothetical protein